MPTQNTTQKLFHRSSITSGYIKTACALLTAIAIASSSSCASSKHKKKNPELTYSGSSTETARNTSDTNNYKKPERKSRSQRKSATAYTQPGSPPSSRPTSPPRVSGGVKPSNASVGDGVRYRSVKVNGPYIAMTFDDGPHASNTPRLLDMLRARNIRATFFLVGQNVSEYPHIVQRMVREGHEVANHSWSHPKLTGLSSESISSQLQRTHDAIVKACGVRVKDFRPPYGAFTSELSGWAYKKFGYRTILWDVDPYDWKKPGSSALFSRIVGSTRSGSIVLVHDIHSSTVNAMPAILDALLAKGYRFVTVAQLIRMEGGGRQPRQQPTRIVQNTPTPQRQRFSATPVNPAASKPAATVYSPYQKSKTLESPKLDKVLKVPYTRY